MDADEFRKRGEEMIDYIVDYLDSLHLRRVTSNVPVGSLRHAMPKTAPVKGEPFEKIMEDVERYIMPGLTHWSHPGFHAYFPSTGSLPATLGIMFADTFGYVGFNWDISPSGSELEAIILDWIGKMLGLPSTFLRYSSTKGAAVMQRSTSESIFIALITARKGMIKQLSNENPSKSKATLLSSFAIYCSRDSYTYIHNAAKVSFMSVKILDTDENFRLRGETLAKAIKVDKETGLVPLFVCVTLGTQCGACDSIDEIGPICKENGIWLHVNADYAGAATICPENRHLLNGVDNASSFSINIAKWMLVPLDCAVMYVKDRFMVINTVIADKTLFGYAFSEKDWGYPSKTEFRSMKLWFVLRMYGVSGLQNHIRNHVRLAKMFEDHVKGDKRFEVVTCSFGLVCFRLVGSDRLNQYLLNDINSAGDLFLIPLNLKGKYVIRFVVCREAADEDDVKSAWDKIRQKAGDLLQMSEMQRRIFSKGLVRDPFEYSVS